jgi:hypothetical protein
MSEGDPAGSTSNGSEGAARLQPQPAADQGNRNRPPCKFFLTRRGCSQGSECRFSHVIRHPRDGEERVREQGVRSGHRSSKPPICQHFLASSGCRYGDKCRYRHVARGEPVTESGDGRGGRGDDDGEALGREVQDISLEGGEGRGVRGGDKSNPLLDLTSFPGLGSAGEIPIPCLFNILCLLCVCVCVCETVHHPFGMQSRNHWTNLLCMCG